MSTDNYCEHALGRLIEIRMTLGYRTRADVDAMGAAIARAAAKVPVAERLVVVTDWQFGQVLSEDAAQYLLKTISINNPRVERSAVLTSAESSVCKLQLMRLLREADNDRRRAFNSASDLVTWLTPVLSTSEVSHLRAFLGQRS